MRLPLETFRYNNKYTSVFSAAKLSCIVSIVAIIIAGRLASANNDIPICHKLWSVLGQDLASWRGRCVEGAHESQSKYCKGEKEYFEDRRRAHRQMCFYEGE